AVGRVTEGRVEGDGRGLGVGAGAFEGERAGEVAPLRGVAGEGGEVEALDAPARDGVGEGGGEGPRRPRRLDDAAAAGHRGGGDEPELARAQLGVGVEVVEGELA